MIPTKISPATAEQLPAVTRLLLTQLIEHQIDISDRSITAVLHEVVRNPQRGFCLVAEQNGEIIGAAYVSYIYALEHGGHSAWLEELYVDPAFRGGVGTALLDAVLAECKTNGCAALDLEIDADHERVSSLYQRYGFRSLPRRRLVKQLDEG